MTNARFTPLAASLPASVPFVGPETLERARGGAFAARLGANENVFGPSPKAIEAMAQAAVQVWQYGDPESFELKQALAAHHGVPAECIVVGEGIDGLLGYLVRLLIREGTPVVTSAGAYPTFNYHVTGFGGAAHMVPYRDDAEDPQALLQKAREVGAPLIYFANPDNPMGSVHDAPVVQDMIDTVPADAILCLDEAYIEFAPDGTAPPLDVANPNVIRFRTFSKAYGMAGARIGYGIAHADLARAFNKVRNHFGVNRIAQIGALAALQDQAYVSDIRDKVIAARTRISQIARDNDLTPLPSAANFVAIDCGGDADRAKAVLAGLAAANIFARMPFVAPQTRCIRLSAGRPTDLDLLAKVLPQIMQAL